MITYTWRCAKNSDANWDPEKVEKMRISSLHASMVWSRIQKALWMQGMYMFFTLPRSKTNHIRLVDIDFEADIDRLFWRIRAISDQEWFRDICNGGTYPGENQQHDLTGSIVMFMIADRNPILARQQIRRCNERGGACYMLRNSLKGFYYL